ncbi:MAG: NitT/TauT family transport system permease protein [Hyphomicrobiales bacterium]|nr:NitT/TauT family transport system permease protein [Hyphomicrobiales bacterium]
MSAVVASAFPSSPAWRVPVARAALVVALLVVWQWAPGQGVDALVSRPNLVAARMANWLASGLLIRESLATLGAVVSGFVLGAAAGAVTGLVAGLWRALGDLVEPWLTALFALPKSAFIPLFILWFGISAKQHTLFVATVVFFFFFFALFNGARAVPAAWQNVFSLAGARPWQTFIMLYMPASFGWFLAAMRLAIPHAFVAAISIEVVASRNGLGHLVKTSSAVLDSTGVITAILWLVLLSTTLGAGSIALAERTRWRR